MPGLNDEERNQQFKFRGFADSGPDTRRERFTQPEGGAYHLGMAEIKTPKKRRRLPWYGRIMIYVLAIYLLYLVLMFFFQHKLIFPAYAAGNAQPNPIHSATQVLEIETSQGTSVAWFIPAPDAARATPRRWWSFCMATRS